MSTQNTKSFGSLIEKLRVEKNVSLRSFCIDLRYDPCYWGKVEDELAIPPKSINDINEIADYLEINEKDVLREELLNLANNFTITKEAPTDDELVSKLPVFFRTENEEVPTERKLRSLVETIRDIHSPDHRSTPSKL